MTDLFWTNLIMVSSIRIISASQTTRGQASQFSRQRLSLQNIYFNIGFRGCSLLQLSFILPSSSEFLYVRAQ